MQDSLHNPYRVNGANDRNAPNSVNATSNAQKTRTRSHGGDCGRRSADAGEVDFSNGDNSDSAILVKGQIDVNANHTHIEDVPIAYKDLLCAA